MALCRAALLCLVLSGPMWAQGKISEIVVEGELRRVAESLILSTIGLSPGIELSHENVQEAARSLYALGVFEDVQLFGAESSDGGVKLIVVLKEYPALEGLRFKGHKELKEKEMKEAIGLVIGQVIAPKDIARGRQRIIELYREKISAAGTVLWNGPLGVFEIEAFAAGTFEIARAVEQATWESGAVTILGGGDTGAALARAGVAAGKVSHVSTGGGASLECLAGQTLPGVAALNEAV